MLTGDCPLFIIGTLFRNSIVRKMFQWTESPFVRQLVPKTKAYWGFGIMGHWNMLTFAISNKHGNVSNKILVNVIFGPVSPVGKVEGSPK